MILNTEEFAKNMIETLPKFYLAEDIKQYNVLRKFLTSAFIGGTDDLIKSINGVRDFSNPLKCPSVDLPTLCESWGITYEPSIPEIYQRKQLAYIGELYRRKGTYSCIKYLVRTVTGYDCDLIYSKDSETGERKFSVVLIADSLQDITSGKIVRDTYAVKKIVPKFLPFYLVPSVAYSSPRGSLSPDTRNIGFRSSERVSNDLTFNGLDNIFINPEFQFGTEQWNTSDNHSLSVTDVKKDSSNCLKSVWGYESFFYQDVFVIYGDAYSTKAYFMSPDEYLSSPPIVVMQLTYYRSNGTVIHSTFKAEVELNIKNKWFCLKRDFYIDDPLCVKVRISYHCATTGKDIYFSSPLLLRKRRVEKLHCADIVSLVPNPTGCYLEWSPVMGATEYKIYSIENELFLPDLIGTQSVCNSYMLSDEDFNSSGKKLLVSATNGYISSKLDPDKCALFYSVCENLGNPISVNDSLEYPLRLLKVYGKSVQDGTPTPDAPVDIVSVGDNGFDIITKDDKQFNLLSVRDNGGDIITKQPVSAVAKVGETATFSVVASGTSLSYQWQYSADNGKTWVNSGTQGNKTNQIIVYNAKQEYNRFQYRCIVTDENRNSEISNAATWYIFSDDCEVKTASIATDALPWCGIPVESGGNYTDSNGQQWICDELIYNADGTGKIVKHTAQYTFTGNENFALRNNDNGRCVYALANFLQYKYYSGTRAVSDKYVCIDTVYSVTQAISGLKIGEMCFYYDSNFPNPPNTAVYFGSSCTTLADFKSEISGSTIIYPLAAPLEIELTAAEVDALRTLQTFNGVTSISNSTNAEMLVRYLGTQDFVVDYIPEIIEGDVTFG